MSFPPFSEDGPLNPRRKEWVEKQVKAAKKMLRKAEQDTKKGFGKLDTYHQEILREKEPPSDEFDGSAWE